MQPLLLAIMGPTASGKTALAEALAEQLGAQLINADAFQVYRGLDIGTGKSEHKDRYALVDVVAPSEQFGLGEWVRLAQTALWEAWGERRSAILVGGTGLYIRALMEEYTDMHDRPSEELRESVLELERNSGPAAVLAELRRLSPSNKALELASNPLRIRRALERVLAGKQPIEIKLPPYRKRKIAVSPPLDVLVQRIDARIEEMLNAGWLDEVARLREAGVSLDAPGLKALGYRNLWQYLEGEKTLETAVDEIRLATRQYAKRQRTWLRSEPGLEEIKWTADLSRLSLEVVSTIL